MARRIKGEVAFEIEEGDLAGDYSLLLDFNALCDLEEDFPGLMDGEFELKSPRAIRKVFAVGLSEKHPGIDPRDAGRIIQQLGLAAAAELIGQAFSASFPAGAEKAANPRKAPARAGAGSEL